MTALRTVAFGKADVQNVLARLDEAQLDTLAFGAIELDATGRILNYNAVEGAITGRTPQAVIGRNFLSDVAPCTTRKEFTGVFDGGVLAKNLNTMFEYVCTHEMKATNVKIHMTQSLRG